MKYIIVLGDGMADRPCPALGGKTPLEAAKKPHIDALCRAGRTGLVKTIPDGMNPGSDTANLAVMGYDPHKYYTGRSPLEAVSMGLQLADTDRTFRCNLVTLGGDGEYESRTLADYSSGEITTRESRILMNHIDEQLGTDRIRFYGGISYRHCMVWSDAPDGFELTPPHDISGRVVGEYMPRGEYADELIRLMKRSCELLHDHPINTARRRAGKNTADSIWLWGDGTRPALPSFYEKYGLRGSVVSAVDLLKGIAGCAGLNSIDVPGATGTVDTNFDGKAAAAIAALKGGDDFVYIHLEAPDECGHHGDVEGKVRSIELIDEKIVGPVLEALEGEEYSVMILPDHPTPIEIMTHSAEPVPYIIYRSGDKNGSGLAYSEANAAGSVFEPGYRLIDEFLKG